ncbi:hypothetical protein EGS38_03375 [Neisseria chenwenguii]|nr:hypothetical protein EGS38_03375 [Neisseria chenwenguii]
MNLFRTAVRLRGNDRFDVSDGLFDFCKDLRPSENRSAKQMRICRIIRNPRFKRFLKFAVFSDGR